MNTSEILKSKKLRKTLPRKLILETLIEADHALSTPVMEEILGELDRVTIYRTLKTFEENGIVHQIMNEKGVMNYALCHHGCTAHDHRDDHIHFECIACGKTYCLDDRIDVSKIGLPDGFVPEKYAFKVKGRCEQCS